MRTKTAKKGFTPGRKFWGCELWPECDGTRPIASTESRAEEATAFAVLPAVTSLNEGPPEGMQGRLAAAIIRILGSLHRARRRHLESDEPDATGQWEPRHRLRVLRYVYQRDGGQCGICGAKMKIKGAHVEHIVPKIFVDFDISGEKAVEGKEYKSVLHKLDNLQAAHTYCNKRKGNSAVVSRWRHSDLSPRTVALTSDGKRLVVPANNGSSGLSDSPVYLEFEYLERAARRIALMVMALLLVALAGFLILQLLRTFF